MGVIGGGDSAMEEASFLMRYASKVYIIHRFDYLEASKVMQRRVLNNPKIEVSGLAHALSLANSSAASTQLVNDSPNVLSYLTWRLCASPSVHKGTGFTQEGSCPSTP